MSETMNAALEVDPLPQTVRRAGAVEVPMARKFCAPEVMVREPDSVREVKEPAPAVREFEPMLMEPNPDAREPEEIGRAHV